VALVALTVSVDEAPALIDPGLAAIVTVGAGVLLTVLVGPSFTPQPVAATSSAAPQKKRNIRPELMRRELPGLIGSISCITPKTIDSIVGIRRFCQHSLSNVGGVR
jgi:hypothetical protein